nr:MAG TPA: hypothetical protein [Caudoviricetes sp.]
MFLIKLTVLLWVAYFILLDVVKNSLNTDEKLNMSLYKDYCPKRVIAVGIFFIGAILESIIALVKILFFL